MKVDIQKVTDAIEMISDFSTDFYDVQTNEIIMVHEGLDTDEQQELYDQMDSEPDRYYRLPSQYELHGYRIMEDFIDNLSDVDAQNKLIRAIHGKGAFRRFKDTVFYLGIREQWFAFQREAYAEIARRWCRDNGLEIEETKIV